MSTTYFTSSKVIMVGRHATCETLGHILDFKPSLPGWVPRFLPVGYVPIPSLFPLAVYEYCACTCRVLYVSEHSNSIATSCVYLKYPEYGR